MISVYQGPLAFLVLCVLSVPSLGQEMHDALEANKAAEAFFTENVQPILKQHCYECHSHDAKEAEGGLVLDSRSGWEKGGDAGPAVVPGKPDESLLISAVRYEDLEMPPDGKLPDELFKQLLRWVADGAVWGETVLAKSGSYVVTDFRPSS